MEAQPAPRRDRPRPAVHPRVILAGVLSAIVIACGLYAAAPWILPVRIHEGPLVQLAGPDGVTLRWFTTRPAECTVNISGDGLERSATAVAAGARNDVRFTGLSPGTRYGYEVRAGRRTLAGGLAFQTVRPKDEPYTFLVFGDSGMGNRVQYLLGPRWAARSPRLISCCTPAISCTTGASGTGTRSGSLPHTGICSRGQLLAVRGEPRRGPGRSCSRV